MGSRLGIYNEPPGYISREKRQAGSRVDIYDQPSAYT